METEPRNVQSLETQSSEVSLAAHLEELSGITWDIIGLSEVRKTSAALTLLSNEHVLCYSGLPDRREYGIGFFIHKEFAGKFDEFFSINESVAVVVIKLKN